LTSQITMELIAKLLSGVLETQTQRNIYENQAEYGFQISQINFIMGNGRVRIKICLKIKINQSKFLGILKGLFKSITRLEILQ